MKRPFEIIEHPADVGFIAYGANLVELLESAALAMLSLACEPSGIEEREQREVKASGGDHEALLYDWLSDILAIADGEGLFFRRVRVTSLEGPAPSGAGLSRARGIAYGEKYDKARHRAGTYIKAVTYHELSVEQSTEGWSARVFLDV